MLRTISGLTLVALLTLSASAFGADVLFVADGSSDDINIPAVLSADGHSVTVVTDDFATGNATLRGPLTAYDVIVWNASGSAYGEVHGDPAVFTNLEAYVNAGGRVFVTGYDSIASPTDAPLYTFIGATTSRDFGGNTDPGPVIDVENSLTVGVVDIRGVTPTGGYGDWDTAGGLQPDTAGVAPSVGDPGFWRWTLRTLGAGEIAYVSNSDSGNVEHPSWLDATPPPSGSGAYNAALRNFVHGAGGIILPPPPAPVLGCVRLLDVRLPAPGGTLLYLRAEIDLNDWSLDLTAPATLEYGTEVVDLPLGLRPNSRRTVWTHRDGDLRVTIQPPRSRSSKGRLTLIDRTYDGGALPRAGDPFHFDFTCGPHDVSADVWLDVDRIYKSGKTPAVMEPLTVRRFQTYVFGGVARRTLLQAEFAGDNVVPPVPPTVILRFGEPGNPFQIRLPHQDYEARAVPGGWMYVIDPASGLHPRRGLWRVHVNYTDRSVTALGDRMAIGAFPRMQAPVFVSLAVGGVESAVEILADVNGGRRLRY